VLATRFILTLAWLCPFLYTNTALSSILNGLGKSFLTLLINIIGLSIRLFSIYIVIPEFGIQGYLWGLLISQLVVSIIFLFCLRLTTAKPFLKNTTKIFSEKHAVKTDLHKFP
jgi:stage V sporulation protein B